MPIEHDYEFDAHIDDYDEAPKPPHGVRFGEDQPINRGGRPQGSLNRATMVKRVAMARQSVTIDGKTRRKSTIELIALAVRLKASQGDPRGFKLFESLMHQSGSAQTGKRAVLISAEKLTNEEWQAVFNPLMSDNSCAEKFPYLMRERVAFQKSQADAARRAKESEATYDARRSFINKGIPNSS